MALNPSNSSNLEQLALKGLILYESWRNTKLVYATCIPWFDFNSNH